MTRAAQRSQLSAVKKELRRYANKEKAAVLRGFFKTKPGEYAAGDVFLGITVPQLRRIARNYSALPRRGLERLLVSAVHEERFLALIIMVNRFSAAAPALQKELYRMYLDFSAHVNNWDLVDVSAPLIVGKFLLNRNKKPLDKLARSALLWQRRIAIVSTLYFIRQGCFSPTLRIASNLLNDGEDLIHKATGWMLREVAKRDRRRAESFLRRHCRVMPRTMLRYAIERFPAARRRAYLRGEA